MLYRILIAYSRLLLLLSIVTTCQAQAKAKINQTVIKTEYGDIYSHLLCGSNCLRALRHYIALNLHWDFNYVELGDSAGKSINALNFHWTAEISPTSIHNFEIVHRLKAIASTIGGGDYYLAESFASIVRYGDQPYISRGAREDRDILMILQLSSNSGNISCSEIMFYNKMSDILEVVPLRKGQLVAWMDGLDYTIRPPCSGSFNAEKFIFFRFRSGKQDIKVKEDSSTSFPRRFFPLKGISEKVDDKYNVHDYLTRKFHDRFGNVIATFDGLFSMDELLKIRRAVLQKGAFSYSDHQTDESDYSDNVSWVSSFEVSSVLSTKVWKVIEELAEYVSGHRGWYPYDVSNNSIERASHTRIHEDCEGKEYEYTFLLYLNPNWTENMYGETIFLEKPVNQGDIYEVITAVKPKFGRVCIFRNSISHSARPPSPDFDGARFTFAVKIASTKKISVAKNIREALENTDDFDESIKVKVHDATIGGKELDMTEAQLENIIEKLKENEHAQRLNFSNELLKGLRRS